MVVIAVVLLGLFGLGSSSFFAASEQRDAAMPVATADGQTVDTQSELSAIEDGTDAKTETEIAGLVRPGQKGAGAVGRVDFASHNNFFFGRRNSL